jgi:hypothetical protein
MQPVGQRALEVGVEQRPRREEQRCGEVLEAVCKKPALDLGPRPMPRLNPATHPRTCPL